MSANDTQIGGEHYRKNEYQHWDWVCDYDIPYLYACASKYIDRWRNKNGIEDLTKARHYMEKILERDIRYTIPHPCVLRFTNQLYTWEANVIYLLMTDSVGMARELVDVMIDSKVYGATKEYVNQDGND